MEDSGRESGGGSVGPAPAQSDRRRDGGGDQELGIIPLLQDGVIDEDRREHSEGDLRSC